MDEMTMVRDLFAEPPPPSAPVTARAWRLLDKRMRGHVVPRRRGHLRHRGRRRLGPIALGAAAAGAAAAIAITALAPAGTHPGPAHNGAGPSGVLAGQPAQTFLLAMATKAAHAPAHGRYWCSVFITGTRGLVGAGGKEIPPAWVDGDTHAPASAPAGYRYAIFSRARMLDCLELPRPGWVGGSVGGSYQSLGSRPASPADFAAWRRDGAPDHWQAWYSNQTISAHPGPRQWTGPKTGAAKATWPRVSLPSSPAKLKAVLLSFIRRRPDRTAYLFGTAIRGTSDQTLLLFDTAIGLMNDPVTPAVRAAAYQVLAGIKGIQMKAGMSDPEGQIGTAVWLGQPGRVPANFTLIDPASGNVLADMNIARTWVDGAPPGTILTYTATLNSRWTNHLPIPANLIAHWMQQLRAHAKPRA